MELVSSKSYFNLLKIFLLRLFKIAADQTVCSKLEGRSVIKYLLAEKCKPCEIYWRMCDVHGEACFSQRMFTNGLNMGLPLQIEQRSVIKSLVAEKCNPCEIYRRMYDVYGEACFSQRNIDKWAKYQFATMNLSQKDTQLS